MFEYFVAGSAPRTAARSLQEGDTTQHGDYELRYAHEETGVKGGRHVIEAHHPEDGAVAKMEWMGRAPYAIHSLDVKEEHRRKGLATAMWNWAQENARPKPKHSRQRTDDGEAWSKSVGGTRPRREASLAEGLIPYFSGDNLGGDIDEYFGGGHGAGAGRGRVAGRGKPRHNPGVPRPRAGDDPLGEDGQQGAPGDVGGGQGAARSVEFHPQAVKDLAKLDKPDQRRIKDTIDALANGEPTQTHPLIDILKGWHTTKASRGHRIVHRTTDDGGIHIGYIGLHEYSRAIRRLAGTEGSCACCGGSREHANGYECYACDSSGVQEGSEKGTFCQRTCPCGTGVTHDPIDGWQHDDGSVSHDGEHYGKSVSDLMKTAASDEETHPLPGQLYHVTTARDAVLASGLKTRQELGQQYGHGLGGGRDDTISLTNHKPTAEHLLHSLHEYHDVLSGKTKLTELKEKARQGVGAKAPYDYMLNDHEHSDERLQEVDSGRVTEPKFHVLGEHPEGWVPKDEGFEGKGKDGEPMKAHMLWDRPLSDEELVKHRSEAYKKFAWGRQSEGGHMNAGFIGNSASEFAKKDPSQFAVLHVQPKPGATGIRMNDRTHGTDAGEWRALSGGDLDVTHHEGRGDITPRTATHAPLHERIFGPTKGSVDPRLFTGDDMKPPVRFAVLERLDRILGPLVGYSWKEWTKVYLAGSEASEWYGNDDFDTLIGIDGDKAREMEPALADMDDDAITDAMNTGLKLGYNASPWKAPFGGTWDLTGYVNKGSYDITRIKPYAAYNITDDTWAVRPPHLPDWDISKFPQGAALLAEAEAYASVIEAVDKMPEPFRTQQGVALWEHLHGDRSRAFSDQGEGWFDPGNVLEKALVEWGLWDKLVQMKYHSDPHARDTPAGWSNDPTAKTAKMTAEEASHHGAREYVKGTLHREHGEMEDEAEAPEWLHSSISNRHNDFNVQWHRMSNGEKDSFHRNLHGLTGKKLFIGLNNVHGVLDTGRMKTLKEIGDAKDEDYTTDRHAYERHVMGVDHDLPHHERPIYGAMHDDPSDNVYGRYHLELKPHVRDRTTVTMGDSMNEALHNYPINHVRHLEHPAVRAMTDAGELHRMSLGEKPSSYMEFQVHGGVSLNDIAALHVHGKLDKFSEAVAEHAEHKGLHVVHHKPDPLEGIPEKHRHLFAQKAEGGKPMRIDLGRGAYADYRPGMASEDTVDIVRPDGVTKMTWGALVAHSNGEVLEQIKGQPKTARTDSSSGLEDYFGKTASDDDYRMQHRPPGRDGIPIHDMTNQGGDYSVPEDVYTHPHYYSQMTEFSNQEAHAVIRRVRGKPEAEVRIYRALPAEHAHQGFRPGDWVTTSKEYARGHGKHHADPQHDWPVISTTVKADDLHTDADDFREFGYNGPEKSWSTVAFKGGHHQEVHLHSDGVIRPVKRRNPKTAMPAKNYPPPEGFSHEVHALNDPTDNDHSKQEQDWPGWNHKILYGKIHGEHAGHIVYSENPHGTAISVGKMDTYRKHRNKGVASAMQDALTEEHPNHWINHGSRTGPGRSWWDSYDDPAPDRNIHNHPHEAWEDDFKVPGGHDDSKQKFGDDERPAPPGGKKYKDVKGEDGYIAGVVRWHGPEGHQDHEAVHDRDEDSETRADVLLNAAQGQGSLQHGRWHDDRYEAQDHAEKLGDEALKSHQGPLTSFIMHKNDDDEIENIAVHHHKPDDGKIRQFKWMNDVEDHYHPIHDKISRQARLDLTTYYGMAA